MNGTLNKVMLIGRLGNDVKLTYFEKESCVGQVAKYVKKGDLLYVEGRLRTRQYQAQDGQVRYITEVVVSDVNFLTPKKSSEEIPPATPTQEEPPF